MQSEKCKITTQKSEHFKFCTVIFRFVFYVLRLLQLFSKIKKLAKYPILCHSVRDGTNVRQQFPTISELQERKKHVVYN